MSSEEAALLCHREQNGPVGDMGLEQVPVRFYYFEKTYTSMKFSTGQRHRSSGKPCILECSPKKMTEGS